MENRTIITYSLLTHLKESRTSEFSSIVELFFPVVKKAIVEYANERGATKVMGKNISEIQTKIKDFFGIEMPPSVLDFILSQIHKEISNEKVFVYNNDKSFIINSFIFDDIDDEIENETNNIKSLKSDYFKFCQIHSYDFNFDDLIKFICSQRIELFVNKNTDSFDFNFHIPKYIAGKFNDKEYFKIISDIYLGSLISSYFEYKIDVPVANTELLIDTNFFMSLIDLNTHEAYLTCSQLFEIGNRLGFRFSILYITIEQIKVLLSTRLNDFASKDIGLIKEADVFGACIRRSLDRTQLERIKDGIDNQIGKFGIDIIHEVRIRDIVEKAKKSDKFKELLELRNNQKLSALNDAIAFHYVTERRGNNPQEFADVKCWFLNNTYHSDHYVGLGYKLHERYKINASELLSLLWLANPSQIQFDMNILSKGGMSTYIAKYRQHKTPSISTIKAVNTRVKNAMQMGELSEKDVFNVSVRMSEGQITNGKASDLVEQSDEKFIKSIKDLTKQEDKVLLRIDEQSVMIKNQGDILAKLQQQYSDALFLMETERYESKKMKFVANQIPLMISNMNKVAWGYLFFVVIVSCLWLLNYIHFSFIGVGLSGVISFIIFLFPLILRFIDHQSVFKCLRVTFFNKYRQIVINELTRTFEKDFAVNNKIPIKEECFPI